ncbi:MAG: Mrp/NBP35 family ATP-binding protein [Anaerolineales bacterium]|nr:Mrp/NBP35 family ATP-binding protein [Anaerolineales bacterium]
MPTVEQIQHALAQVIDPELGANIVELGMVRDIHIADGHINITLALTMMACPLRNHLQEQTQMAAATVPGVESVTVELTAMTDGERESLKERMSTARQLNRVNRMVAVMSGKGGVGKSSVTALLASALRRMGFSVGVMDADITGPSIPHLFGISGPVQGIPMGILPIETRTGIKVMSTNLMLPNEDMAVVWRGPVMSGAIKQFWKDVLWGRLDYLLIDLPPGTSDATLTVMQSLPLDGVVMVATPQRLASMVVRKTVHMSQDLEIPIIGIVENMSYFTCPETGTQHHIFGPSHAEEVAELAEAPILGRLPIDPRLAQLADDGEMEQFDNAAYSELAAAFVGAVPLGEPEPAASRIAEDQVSE